MSFTGKALGRWLVLMLLVAPLAAQTRARATMRSEVADPGKFMFLTINGGAAGEAFAPCLRSLRECALARLVLFGYDGFGGPAETAPREEVFTFASKKKTVSVFHRNLNCGMSIVEQEERLRGARR